MDSAGSMRDVQSSMQILIIVEREELVG